MSPEKQGIVVAAGNTADKASADVASAIATYVEVSGAEVFDYAFLIRMYIPW